MTSGLSGLARRLRRLTPRELERLGAQVYPDPDPMDTLEEALRAHHADLVGFTLDEIDRERVRANLRWALSRDDSAWLTERRGRLEAARAALLAKRGIR